jgi:hypothetical protein
VSSQPNIDEDFESYAPGDSPADWVDQAQDFTTGDYFQTLEVDGQMAYGPVDTGYRYSHYNGAGALDWQNYEVTGRLRFGQDSDGIALTFYSQFPANQDRYYQLLRYSGESGFRIHTHGASNANGTKSVDVNAQPGIWYRFRLRVQTATDRVRIVAKVWAEGDPEPETWQIDCYNSYASRITAGTVGIWSQGSGTRAVDDLLVQPLDPAQLTGFPLGLYDVDTASFATIQAAGLDRAHRYNSTQSQDDAIAYLQAAEAVGLDVMQNMPSDYLTYSESFWTDWIDAVSSYNALAVWYLPEEPTNQTAIERLHDLIRLRDPQSRPAGTYFAALTTLDQWCDSVDVLHIGAYPEYSGQPRASMMARFDIAQEACPDIPIIGVPMLFDTNFDGTGDYPTPHEARADAYTAFIAGVRGLHWYSYAHGQNLPDLWQAVQDIVAELNSLQPVLVASDSAPTAQVQMLSGPAQSPPVSGRVYDSIQIKQKVYQDEIYLFAVNLATDTVVAEFSNLSPEFTMAEVLFEDRSLSVTSGAFSDSFAEADVHIYRLSTAEFTPTSTATATPTETPSPTATLTPTPTETPTSPAVIINEIAWSGTAASTADEWIELYNNTAAIDLTGWVLTDDGDINITLSGTITANGYFLLECTDDTTISDVPADQIYTGSLLDDGETLVLRDGANAIVDTANNNGGAWPSGTTGSGSPPFASMERIDPLAADSDANWSTNDGVTRNGLDASGDPINGTPRREAGPVVDLWPCTIHVQKYEDLDGDGVKDGGEPGLNDWTITLYDVLDNPVFTDTTDTIDDEDGWVRFENVPSGTYTVCETLEDGWVNSDPGGDAPYCKSVSVNDEQTVQFGNYQPGSITLIKELDPTSDPGKFDLQIDGSTEKDEASHSDSTVAVEVSIGTHTVGETADDETSLDDYSTTISCQDDQGAVTATPENSATWSVKVGADQDIICTITNTRRGKIVIEKVTDPRPDPTNTSFAFAAGGGLSPTTFSLKDDESQTFDNLLPGSGYSVTETVPSGWDLTSATCSDDSPVDNINVSPGETVICTFTNKATAPTLTVIKEVINDDGGTLTAGDFDLFVNGDPVTSGVANTLQAGVEYTVSETEVAGYELAEISGDCAPDGTITLESGDEAVCNITNDDNITPTLTSSITIVKDALGANSKHRFRFTGDLGDFSLTHLGSQDFSNLDPGSYTVAEDPNSFPDPYWYLLSVVCEIEGGQSFFPDRPEDDDFSTIIPVEVGQHVTCTFHNEQADLEEGIYRYYFPLIFKGRIQQAGEAARANKSSNRPLTQARRRWRR